MRTVLSVAACHLAVLAAAWPLPCAAQEAKQADAEESPIKDIAEPGDPLDVETILGNPLSDEDYRERRNCLPRRAIDDVEILDDRLVLFHGRLGELWLNQLSSQCLGLEPEMIPELRVYGGSLCSLDRFRGKPRYGTFAITAECRLGRFETVAAEQVEAMRRAISERRQAADAAQRTKKQAKGNASPDSPSRKLDGAPAGSS